jgi:hypothetical protein
MKKLTLTFCALFALFVVAPALYADGPEPSSKEKEVMQPAPPVCDFYRAHEWDLDIWGAYMFAQDTGHNNVPDTDPFFPDVDPFTVNNGFFVGDQAIDNPNERVNIGQWSKNRLFARDDTFGGGADVKYFWSRYFGFGVEGLGIAAKTNFAGGGLLTLTARYPFGRFAPYVTGGMGFVDGGATLYKFFNEKAVKTVGGFVTVEDEFFTFDPVAQHYLRPLGQIGAGVEFRVTCHIGLMADFTYNFVFGLEDHGNKFFLTTEQGNNIFELNGIPVLTQPVINQAFVLKPSHSSDNQNFGMARFGVTFSY